MADSTPRPQMVGLTTLGEAARTFVASMGTLNAHFLRENLGYTGCCSDALRALKDALAEDYAEQREVRP